MTAKDVLASILPMVGHTQASAGQEIGWTLNQINHRVISDSLRITDLYKLMDALGVEIQIVDKGNGEVIPVDPEKEINAKMLLETIMPVVGTTPIGAAAKIGWNRDKIYYRMVRDSLRVTDFYKLMDAVGVELRYIVKDTGKAVTMIRRGHGRPLKKMSKKVIYHTALSQALSNSFYAEGSEYDENGEAQELYIDKEGRYFIAEYHKDAPEKDKIVAVPASIAKAFVEKYGTEIEKESNA